MSKVLSLVQYHIVRLAAVHLFLSMVNMLMYCACNVLSNIDNFQDLRIIPFPVLISTFKLLVALLYISHLKNKQIQSVCFHSVVLQMNIKQNKSLPIFTPYKYHM